MYVQWNGNRKMDVPVWSLPPKLTCIGATELCKKICYSNKAWRWQAVRQRRMENYVHSKSKDFPKAMIKLIQERLEKKPFDKFRIHESGDFYSQEYFDKWCKIAEAFPNIKFLAFTKSYQIDFSKHPDNLVIYYSVMPDTKVIPKNMRLAFVIGKGLKYKTIRPTGRVCPYPEKNCRGCGYKCWDGDSNVIFRKH